MTTHRFSVRHRAVAGIITNLQPDAELGTRRDLLRHSRLLDRIAVSTPVLPVRFGSVLATPGAVVDELLAPHHDELETGLSAVRGRAQFTVKARYVEDAVLREVVAEEPEVARLHDVYLYTVDDLSALVQTAGEKRQAAVAQAEAIIEAQVGHFMHWMRLREGVPLIRALRDEADAARCEELERALKALERGGDPAQVLEALSRKLTNKLMHGPTQALAETLVRLNRPK